MTNVKLKLMFFLLSALLSADIVDARPYPLPTNTTDMIRKYSYDNNTFSLPVDSNADADTLVIANDRETPEEANVRSNNQMEALLNAEQDRDVALSKKTMKEQGQFEMPKKDADALEQQMNTSSSLMEEIMDSETNREERLTDIAELVDMPKFEFLIGARINETVSNKSGKTNLVNSFDRNSYNYSDVKQDFVELVEVMKPTRMSENKSAYFMLNITEHEVEDDLAPDTILSMFSGFTDLQTLFLACFATLVPLLCVLCATLVIRCMCRKWCPGCCKKRSESLDSESSEKDDASLKSPTYNGKEETLQDSDSQTANGSIFTMTMKNNHLIVETEERTDITKNGRETKMKYSPDNDGIFVVEVQQSTAYRPNNKPVQNSPHHDPQISTNQALIHRVPDELEKRISEEESDKDSQINRTLALSNTGLSISDISMSSVGSHNTSYAYGNQTGYEHGPFGYPIYAGYDINKEIVCCMVNDSSQEPLITKTPTDPDKPVVTAAIFKQDSIIVSDVLQGPGYCIEGSSDGPLLSDVQAREVSLQHLHDQREKKLENGVAVPVPENNTPKKVLNRADSLPVRLEDEKVLENAMDTIQEDEIPEDVFKGKRASLPVIRTEMYESVKGVLIPTGSPKFELLNNDVTPVEVVDNPLPMIMISEETETRDNSS